jgi:hypothetical protein
VKVIEVLEVLEDFGTYRPSDDRRFSREVTETIAQNKRLEIIASHERRHLLHAERVQDAMTSRSS